MKTDIKQDVIFGIHPIIELIKAKKRKLYAVFTTKPQPKAWQGLAQILPSYTKVEYIDKEKLNKLAGTTDHQGVVGLASPIIVRKKFFDASREKFLVMLDEIQDPRNLGAILRSAYCTGAQGVIITQKSSAPLNAVAIKSSAGLSEHLEIYFSQSPKHAVTELKNAGYNIYLSALTPKANALAVDYKLPLCIVIGNEGTGISPTILNSGEHITLPQITSDISYNASVAAGILLFTIATKNKII